jgi:NAD(P)-dependent dehydrogenase (short-subunit alcohol dehydrogenase family)
VERHTDGLDGIVNCAGILVVGSVIEVPESDLLHILDVSLLGTYRINKAFFHLVLRRRGRIVNLSSEIGWQTAAPFNGPYAMAKHALEAYSDALRRELMFLGIKVIKIQPGSFHTNLVAGVEAAFERAIASAPYLGDILRRNMYLAVAELAKSHDPVLVARVIHKALTTPHPKIAYSIKPDPLRSFLDRLPTPLLDFLIYRALKR